jgi:putative hemolysin
MIEILENLVSKEEVIETANLRKLRLTWIAEPLMSILGVHAINKFYSAIPPEPVGLPFLETAMKNHQISYPVSGVENIPKAGAFITVSNHPFGFLDGILLILAIGKVRPDIKIMANFWLKRMPSIRDFFIAVDPYESAQQTAKSLAGTRLTLQTLKDGHPVGIFPAGEVSTYHQLPSNTRKKIQDRQWQLPVIKVIKKTKVPIVPVYFEGQNSFWFHLLGKINPALRTPKIVGEFMNKRGKTIPIHIGMPIEVEKQNEFENLEDFALFLRNQTYDLAKR